MGSSWGLRDSPYYFAFEEFQDWLRAKHNSMDCDSNFDNHPLKNVVEITEVEFKRRLYQHPADFVAWYEKEKTQNTTGVTRRPLMQGLQETNISESFHVFLSHNSKDKPIVRELAQKLTESCNLRVWLDEDQLVPGRSWQEALEKIIQTTQAAAVLIGESGLGPWEDPEMRACLSEFVNRKLPVIPVLLPDTPATPKLPLFLKSFTWVDLRDGLTDPGLEKLVWGITGVKPAKPARLAGGGLHPKST